jgi:hypothetical protein
MGIAKPFPIPQDSAVNHVSKWAEPQRLDKHLIEKSTADHGVDIAYTILKEAKRNVVTTSDLIAAMENSVELKTTDGMAPSHSTMRRWINTARDRLRMERMIAA